MSVGRALAERLDAPDAETAMRRACAALLANAGQYRPPIRLRALMSLLSVPWDFSPSSSTATECASLSFSTGELTLRIDRRRFKEHPGRARFSIAHEIGHLILMRALGPEVFDLAERDDRSYREAEALCDLAASHLLLPRTELTAALRFHGLRRAGLMAVRKVFDVSETAALRAIADLLPDGSILEWRKFCRGEGEPMVWRVWRTLRPADPSNRRPWLPRGCTEKHLSVDRNFEKVPLDEPSSFRGIKLNLGKTQSFHDGVISKWLQSELAAGLPFDRSRAAPARHGSDRIIVVLGAPNRSDLSIFDTQEQMV